MRKPSLLIQHDETAKIDGVDGKKVFVIDDSGNQIVKFRPDTDDSTEAAISIDYVHHEIHEGDHYYIEGHTTMGDGGVLMVKLATNGENKDAHFQWAIASSGILETTLHEDASGGMAGGTGVTPLNNNRNSDNTSLMTITMGVSGASINGTLISNAKWGASGFKTQIGGGTSRDDELILKQDTVYLRTFTSGAADNIVQFKAGWYEHEDLG